MLYPLPFIIFFLQQVTSEQYQIDVDDAIATVAKLTDLQKMTAELFDVKFPFLQPSLDHICRNCSLVSSNFHLVHHEHLV